MRRAQALAAEHPEWCFLYQYGNAANPRAHYEGTGPEIWRDCPEITHFVAGLGTSGTLMGVGRFLKEQNPDIKVLRRRAAGRRAGRGPAQPRRGLHPAGVRAVATATSCSTASASCGPASRSSGPAAWSTSAACSPASRRARRWPARPRWPSEIDEGVIVFIVCDGGWKYLSTGAWTDDLDEVEAAPRRSSTSDRRSLGGFGTPRSQRAKRTCGARSLRGGRRPPDRDVRQRLRRPHRRPGPHRPAAREDLVYFGDTGRYPYGPRPARRGARRSPTRSARYLVDEHDVKLVVVACNTAAAAALDDLQRELAVPVIGVIEPGRAGAGRAPPATGASA